MTFKDLKKRVSLETTPRFNVFERLQNKPFWIWNIEEHKLEDIKTNGDCCFNHIIGLPTKSYLRFAKRTEILSIASFLSFFAGFQQQNNILDENITTMVINQTFSIVNNYIGN